VEGNRLYLTVADPPERSNAKRMRVEDAANIGLCHQGIIIDVLCTIVIVALVLKLKVIIIIIIILSITILLLLLVIFLFVIPYGSNVRNAFSFVVVVNFIWASIIISTLNPSTIIIFIDIDSIIFITIIIIFIDIITIFINIIIANIHITITVFFIIFFFFVVINIIVLNIIIIVVTTRLIAIIMFGCITVFTRRFYDVQLILWLYSELTKESMIIID